MSAGPVVTEILQAGIPPPHQAMFLPDEPGVREAPYPGFSPGHPGQGLSLGSQPPPNGSIEPREGTGQRKMGGLGAEEGVA